MSVFRTAASKKEDEQNKNMSDMSGSDDGNEVVPIHVFNAPNPCFSEHWGELSEYLSGDAKDALRVHLERTQEAASVTSTPRTVVSDSPRPIPVVVDDNGVTHTAETEETNIVEEGGVRSAVVNHDYGTLEYWDTRFAEEEHYDWLLTFPQISKQVLPLLSPYTTKARILIVGCGNSSFSADLYDIGYTNIVNLDYSGVVIERMKSLHGVSRPMMTWIEMDMTCMAFPNRKIGDEEGEDVPFDIVIDKAALDAIMVDEKSVWDPANAVVNMADDTCKGVRSLLRGAVSTFASVPLPEPVSNALKTESDSIAPSMEALVAAAKATALSTTATTTTTPVVDVVDRVDVVQVPLRGLYLMISFMQPHFRTKYLSGAHADRLQGGELNEDIHSQVSPSSAAVGYCPRYDWTQRYEVINKEEGGSFQHFLYIMYCGKD